MIGISELKSLPCEVLTDNVSRQVYATDASIYEITPQAIVIPRSKSDILHTFKIARTHGIPIIPRGAATGITGGAIGNGIVIDTSKHLNKIITINPEQKYAIVEPGVVQDVLNNAVHPYGLALGPDTSTGNRATLGGMVANNAAGSHSLRYRQMADHIMELEMLLWDGSLLRFSETTDWSHKCLLNSSEGMIYRSLEEIIKQYGNQIRTHFPTIERISAGYNLRKLLKKNIMGILAGSEGTLGFITEITVRLVEKPKNTTLTLIAYDDMIRGVEEIGKVRDLNPCALEMIDRKIIEAGVQHPALKGKLDWLKSIPEVLFIAELEEGKKLENAQAAWIDTYSNKDTINSIWDLRKAGLGLLLSKKSYSRAVAFIEDLIIPPERASHFLQKFLALLKEVGKDAGIYGHIGAGCLHIRPYIDMRQREEVQLMQTLMEKVCDIVADLGGAMSSEHGTGILRAQTTERMFGKELFKAMCAIKEAFDPHNLMNPGKIIPEQEFLEHLRLSPETEEKTFPTFYTYEREGSFSLTSDLCNGNGQCRKQEGLMCPSFQVTHDEKDSTRARANAFRALIHGKISMKEAVSKEFYDVLDLCIQCKGCKTECPSQVDMAKLKSEYLYMYHKKKGYPLHSYLFGYIGNLFHIASHFPRLSNAIASLLPLPRKPPRISKKRFSKLWKGSITKGQKVVLFIDTFTEFCLPEQGLAAAKLLEAMGFSVITPAWQCCGRTLFSKGFLPQAKNYAANFLQTLFTYAHEKIPIIGLEPSCTLTIKDEWRDLGLPQNKIEEVIAMSSTLDEFLLTHKEKIPFSKTDSVRVYLHTHCHQKALVGSQPTLALLRSTPGVTLQEIPSGCCGMAGSFGYEKEHYNFSLKIANLILIPFIRKLQENDIVITNGFSCRSQINDTTHKKPLHLAEFLYSRIM